MTLTLYRFNNNTIFLDARTQASNGDFANSETSLTMTLVDPDAVNVPDAIDLPMTYVSSSNGQYQGVIPSTLDWTNDVPVGADYHLVISSDVGEKRTLPVVVVDRVT